MSDNDSKDTMDVGSGFRAFAIGVNAGSTASAKLAQINELESASYPKALAYYWLLCGAAMVRELPEGTNEDDQLQFIAGAATRAPSGPPVSIAVTNVEGSAFGEEGDEDERRAEVGRIIHDAAHRIESGDEQEGSLRDLNGNTVGSYTYDPWVL